MKLFEYKGPKIIKKCGDCLYCHAAYDEETYCFHPDNTEHSDTYINDKSILPDWCPLPDLEKQDKAFYFPDYHM